MMQIIDIVDTCSSPTLSFTIDLVQKILSIVQIMGPIVLLIALTIHFTKLMINPEEKEASKKIKNSIIATVILFLVPFFINFSMRLLDNSFSISTCWNSKRTLSGSTEYHSTKNNKKVKIIRYNGDDYDKAIEDNTETSSTSTSGSEREILSTTNSEKYFPALQGKDFSISGASETGGCKNSGKVRHDLNIKEGTKIYAAFDGTIEYIQYLCNDVLYSYGNQARLTDPNTNTYVLYGHLSKFVGATAEVTKTCHSEYGKSAKCGASDCPSGIKKKTILKKQVQKGELIGYTGNTGNSDGPHLHVEIHENGSSKCLTDPYKEMGMH